MQKKPCMRCLLQDTDKKSYAQSVQKYRASLMRALQTPPPLYESRLAACLACKNLVNAVCSQCGCYVEMRAARLDMHCPNGKAVW